MATLAIRLGGVGFKSPYACAHQRTNTSHASGDRMSEKEEHAHSASIQIRTVPDAEMPEGIHVVPIERDEHLTVCFREGHISDQARDAFNTLMRGAIGMLSQNWGGPRDAGPPQEPA